MPPDFISGSDIFWFILRLAAAEPVVCYSPPTALTNITGCPQTPEALELDMPVEVAFEKLDDEITLPLFRPARR